MSSPFEVETVADPSVIAKEWRQLERTGVGTVFQRYDWVEAYVKAVLRHKDAQPAIVLGRLYGQPAFVLPLAISRYGPVRFAHWIGGKHSGYNFGLWSIEAAAAMAHLDRKQVEGLLRAALDGADCLFLGNTLSVQDGIPQPLGSLTDGVSSTKGYSFGLSGGFPAVLARTNGKGRRRKIDAKQRRMQRIGATHYATIRDPDRALAALDFFFEQKTERLAVQHQPNSFAEPGVKDFFRDLLMRSHNSQEPLLEMAELTVAGRRRAVLGSGLNRGRVNVYFTAFAQDEVADHSPGLVLSFRHIEESCLRGMESYDLGIGYERYKSSWCDIEHEMRDAYAAFTPAGTAAVAAMRFGQMTKSGLRRNTLLWRYLKSAQSLLPRPVSR